MTGFLTAVDLAGAAALRQELTAWGIFITITAVAFITVLYAVRVACDDARQPVAATQFCPWCDGQTGKCDCIDGPCDRPYCKHAEIAAEIGDDVIDVFGPGAEFDREIRQWLAEGEHRD